MDGNTPARSLLDQIFDRMFKEMESSDLSDSNFIDEIQRLIKDNSMKNADVVKKTILKSIEVKDENP